MGWIGVDLDRCLAFYDEFHGVTHIGEPIPKMVERVKRWLAEGKEVRIVTARVCSEQKWEDRNAALYAIGDWCEKHLGQVLVVTSEKDFEMEVLYDDRCKEVIPNTGELVSEDIFTRVEEVRRDLEKHLRDDSLHNGNHETCSCGMPLVEVLQILDRIEGKETV